jgi:hypothetical protein
MGLYEVVYIMTKEVLQERKRSYKTLVNMLFGKSNSNLQNFKNNLLIYKYFVNP